ncbi:hypothetical protein [Halomonas maura]|nr:hypothetical protein [Halomonas maura]MDN3557438.1 hypothetical protein [Halomonas maura]
MTPRARKVIAGNVLASMITSEATGDLGIGDEGRLLIEVSDAMLGTA